MKILSHVFWKFNMIYEIYFTSTKLTIPYLCFWDSSVDISPSLLQHPSPNTPLSFHQKHNFEIDYNFTHLQFTEIDYNISPTLEVSLTQQNEKQTIVADCMCRCHNQFNNLTSPTSDFPIDPSTHNLNSLLLSNNGIFFT